MSTRHQDTSQRLRPQTLRPGSRPYPAVLERISDPPPVLHLSGQLADAPCVAIVGSRECTRYGRSVATRLAFDLASVGVVIVSGMARGIDAAAHRGALQAGGRTVAVLPGGLHPVYPQQHRALAKCIVARGALLAEHEPGTAVARWHFPKRNRIIAGMSLVTVVVEAAQRSGARITADLALDYDREVLVVPGPITSPTSVGCNALLSQGAHPCTGAADVVAHLPPTIADRYRSHRGTVLPENLGEAERAVLAAIRRRDGATLEDLLQHTGLATAAVLATVGALEIRGLIERLPGNLVCARQVPSVQGTGDTLPPAGI